MIETSCDKIRFLGSTMACNETELLDQMQECVGIMYFIVIPNAAMKNDKVSLANACE